MKKKTSVQKKSKSEKNIKKGSPTVEENWKEKYLRALADYRNLENRMGTEVARSRTQAQHYILQDFLRVLDDMERADVFVSDPGLKLVREQFLKVLTQSGVVPMNLVGKPFNPDTAECVQLEESADKDGIVLEEVRKGYMLGQDVLRVAQVKVGKAV